MFVFPGQGSQYVGMGSDLCDQFEVAQRLYEQANDVLGFDVQKLSFEGPDEDLTLTRNTQPALLTHSIACLEVFKELTDGEVTPAFAAGHSLGEYTALVASGALSFEDALRLVRQRGELMGKFGRGKMLAFKQDLETVRGFADRFFCGIGGCNLPEQTVVGGTEEDLAALTAYAAEQGSKGIPLKTEGAFHTYLMVSAAEAFRPALAAANIQPLQCTVLSNYTGEYHEDDAERIKAYLFFQLFNPVKWIWGVQQAINDGVNLIVEFGGGIGRGEGPENKRPNLQSITKKAFQGAGKHGLHFPAINVGTLRETARLLKLLGRVEENNGASRAGDELDLMLPIANGVPVTTAVNTLKKAEGSGLGTHVHLVAEPAEETQAHLAKASGEESARPEPYVKVEEGLLTGEAMLARIEQV